MNFKIFIFMILTFRRIDPIPRNIGIMVSVMTWISIIYVIFIFTILIIQNRNLVNRYVERHIKDRHLSDDTIKEIKIAYIAVIKDFIAIVDKSTSMNEDDIIYVVNNISSILYEPIEISNTDKKILEIGIALGLKGAISCIFGSLSKDDCNIKDEIIDISKHIKEKLISDNHG